MVGNTPKHSVTLTSKLTPLDYKSTLAPAFYGIVLGSLDLFLLLTDNAEWCAVLSGIEVLLTKRL